MPHFSGNYRQRGSGIGTLAMGIGQVALPLARKFIVPAAKRIGKELLVQAAHEIIDLATKKKSHEKHSKKHNQKTSWSWTQQFAYEKKTEDNKNNNNKKKNFHSKETNSTEKSLQFFHQSTKRFLIFYQLKQLTAH